MNIQVLHILSKILLILKLAPCQVNVKQRKLDID
jgi:hypothetical protein